MCSRGEQKRARKRGKNGTTPPASILEVKTFYASEGQKKSAEEIPALFFCPCFYREIIGRDIENSY